MSKLVKNKKKFFIPALLFIFLLPGCMVDDYEIEEDNINLEFSFGGDSLALPLLQTNKIYLGTLLDDLELGLLTEMDDGSYEISVADTMFTEVSMLFPFEYTLEFDMPEAMAGTVLDLDNPFIELGFGNPLSDALDLALEINIEGDDQAVVDVLLDVTAAPAAGERGWSYYRLVRDVNKKPSDDFISIAADLSSVIRSILLKEVKIKISPTYKDGIPNNNFVADNTELQLNINLGLPLNLGPDFAINYVDTIQDLEDMFEGMLEMLPGKIELVASIENALPLGLSFETEALDINAQPIAGLDIITSGEIASGNKAGNSIEPVTSNLILSLEGGSNALEKLSKLRFAVSAKSGEGVAGIPFRNDQYIKLKVKARVPGGIKIDPNQFDSDSDN